MALYGAGKASAAARSAVKSKYKVDEKTTPIKDVTTYNNFYEFGLDKADPAALSGNFKPLPWTVKVDGMVGKPGTFDIDALIKEFPIGRAHLPHALRRGLVDGHPLGRLSACRAARQGGAARQRQVRRLRNGRAAGGDAGPDRAYSSRLNWPYVEGLRLDEARHPLTLLAVGLYGETLPNQNGAPIRLVVPWKYGFKGIKSIVRITLTDKQPQNTWQVDQPAGIRLLRQRQPGGRPSALEPGDRTAYRRRRFLRRQAADPTLPFNGYADEVASLYAGMDLRANF